MKHKKFLETVTLVKSNEAVLLTGEKGTGKSTLAMDVAKELGLEFCSVSMTRQTTLSHLQGFMNVNGTYIPSQLRSAVETGKMFLLDEIDAGDANVLLCLNSLENGYLSFPDKIVYSHKNFRLMATSNPQDNHKDYNGRSKLDAATLDRFDIIELKEDTELEKSLVDFQTYSHIELIRKCLKESNSPTHISMRDTKRFQKRKDLKLLDSYVDQLLTKDLIALEKYNDTKHLIPKVSKITECETIKEVWEHIAGDKPIAQAVKSKAPFF